MFLGGVCLKTGINTNVSANSNTAVNSSISKGNENVSAGELDTSDWQTYTNNVIGLQFDYPTSGKIEFHSTDCTKTRCDSTTGLSYYINTTNEIGDLEFAFAGASTSDFQAGRDLGFFDVTYFRNDNDGYEAMLSNDEGFTIHPTQHTAYKNGDVVIYEIKDLPSYPQLLDVIPERKDDKVAIYNFNKAVNGFKSISIILTPEMNEQDIGRILNSLIFL